MIIGGNSFSVVANAATEKDVRHAVRVYQFLRNTRQLRFIDPVVVDFFHVALLIERQHCPLRHNDGVPLDVASALLRDNLGRTGICDQSDLDAAFLFERFEDRLVLGFFKAATERRNADFSSPLDGRLSAHYRRSRE